MTRLAPALLFAALLAVPALAQDLPDAALPDASVGQGGAEQTSEENDVGGPCLDTRDCQGRFVCQGGRCVPTAVKTTGCGSAPLAMALGAGLVLVGRRRR